MNFDKIKSNINSKEGLQKISELNELNVAIQEMEYNLNFRKMRYQLESLKFKEFIGYELTEEEKKEVSNLEEAIAKMV